MSPRKDVPVVVPALQPDDYRFLLTACPNFGAFRDTVLMNDDAFDLFVQMLEGVTDRDHDVDTMVLRHVADAHSYQSEPFLLKAYNDSRHTQEQRDVHAESILLCLGALPNTGIYRSQFSALPKHVREDAMVQPMRDGTFKRLDKQLAMFVHAYHYAATFG